MQVAITESPTLLFSIGFTLFVIPLIILAIGFMISYFKPKTRRLTGVSLVVIGALELVLFSIVYQYMIARLGYFSVAITLLVGFVFIFYSMERTSKS